MVSMRRRGGCAVISRTRTVLFVGIYLLPLLLCMVRQSAGQQRVRAEHTVSEHTHASATSLSVASPSSATSLPSPVPTRSVADISSSSSSSLLLESGAALATESTSHTGAEFQLNSSQIVADRPFPGELTVKWPPVKGGNLCGPVSYNLTLLDVDFNSTVTQEQVEGKAQTELSFTFHKLHSDRTYAVEIVASDTCRTSDTAISPTVKTIRTVPGQVESLRVISKNGTSVEITWTPPHDDLQYYVIRLSLDDVCVRVTYLQPSTSKPDKGKTDKEGQDGGNDKADDPCQKPLIAHGDLNSPHLVLGQLLPETLYTFSIMAVNDVGSGMPRLLGVQTGVAVPTAPTEFQVVEVRTDSVILEWTPPDPRPGPTSYLLNVTDLGSPYQDSSEVLQSFSTTCPGGKRCGQNYKTSKCLVDKLKAYWRYNFTLMAHTDESDSEPVSLNSTVVTEQSTPGAVEDVQVERADSVHPAVTVQWRCPSLEHRHSLITGFLVKAVHLGEVSGNETVDVQYVSSEDCETNHSLTLLVSPEWKYIFQVLTLGQLYNATQWTSTDPYTVPPGLSDAVTGLTVEAEGDSNVTVLWTAPQHTYGRLRAYGIKVQNEDGLCLHWTTLWLQDTPSESDPFTSWAHCSVASYNTDVVADSNQTFDLTLTGLPPASLLIITVYPKNDAGWGSASNVTAHTEEIEPSAPRHPSVEYPNATSLQVNWLPPEPRPGDTNYTLTLLRAVHLDSASTYLRDRTVLISGWSVGQAVLTDLWSGWRYSLTITVTTSKGSRTVQLSQPIQMPESAPGKVQNMSVQPVDNDYRMIRVLWDCPEETERHGYIQNFTLCWQRVGSGTKQCQVKEQQCESTSPQFCTVVPATPGVTYFLSIRANNEYSGVQTDRIFKAAIGPPPTVGHVTTTAASGSIGQSTFSISFCAACLLNDTNGQIVFTALLVCAERYCHQVNTSALKSYQDIVDLPSWSMAKNSDFRTLYRPTGDAWVNTTRAELEEGSGTLASGTAVDVYVVGEDGQCASQDSHLYCNGPLPAGRAFRVLSVTCTSTACKTSALSPPIQTLAPDTAVSVTIIVIGCVLGVLAGLLVVVLVIWSRRRRHQHKDNSNDRTEDEQVELADMPPKYRAVAIQDYGDTLRKWKSKLDPDTQLPSALVRQFDEIKQQSPQHRRQAAVMDDNKVKNRYTNILPFDHSRVKLVQLDDDITSDYINANYIQGYHSKREFIATQGPLQSTVADFWRMVWEQRSPVIVMLSPLVEGHLQKVYKYYPEEPKEPLMYGMVTVTLETETVRDCYLIRKFTLSLGQERHSVQQFVIDQWKDFDANLNSMVMLEFVRAVRREVPADNRHPLVVHCSAGVGRTGTFIAVDYFMYYIKHSPPTAPVDIMGFVLSMRDCRAHMVQALEQYVFLHEVVAELVRPRTEVDHYDELHHTKNAAFANVSVSDKDSDGKTSSAVSDDDTSSSLHQHLTTSNGTASQPQEQLMSLFRQQPPETSQGCPEPIETSCPQQPPTQLSQPCPPLVETSRM